MALTAAGSESTRVARAAPRDSASMPRAPLPANRSTTDASSSCCMLVRMENTASRTRSLVGRVSLPDGALRERPLAAPATTLTRLLQRSPTCHISQTSKVPA